MLGAQPAFRFGPFRLRPARRALTRAGEVVPLNGRPFDLLVALVERHDRVVSKDELKTLVWPDAAAVEDHTLVVTLSAVRKALSNGGAAGRHIATIANQGYRFLYPVEPDADDALDTGPSPNASPQHHFPVQPDRLVGRQEDIAALLTRLATARVLTLTGTGGIGKTRLATALMAVAAPRYPDGTWFVELAALNDPRLIGETIASMFGLTTQGRRPALDAVTTFLRRKRLLLALDNCEHLIEESARAVDTIVRACPGVTILATSRERLAIAGEVVYPVKPLATPGPGNTPTAADALRFSAVELFVERATMALGEFVLTDEMASAVAEICRRLDGLALAIELAVVRLELLEPAALLAHLDARFQVLAGRGRRAAPRHQKLISTIDWSYDLLATFERTLLRRLAVFSGSFTIASAAAVALGNLPAQVDAIPLMLALVEKSLVLPMAAPIPDPAGGRRFRLLETIRAYGEGKLAADERAESLCRLSEYLIAFYRQGEASWFTMEANACLAIQEPDLDNLRTALDWAFGTAGDAALGVCLVAYTLDLWIELSLIAEWRRWLEIAESRIDATTPSPIVARIRFAVARTGFMGERKYLAAALEAHALFHKSDELLLAAAALSQAGRLLLRPGDYAEADHYVREGLALLRPYGATRFLVGALDNIVALNWFSDDLARARHYLEELHTVALQVGHVRILHSTEIVLAELDFSAGRKEAALSRARHTLAACRSTGDLVGLGCIAQNLAAYLLSIDEAAEGCDVGRESLELALSVGRVQGVIISIQHLALAAALGDDIDLAARLAGYVTRVFEAENWTREPLEQSLWTKLLVCLGRDLSAERLSDRMAEGAVWTDEAAIGAALRA